MSWMEFVSSLVGHLAWPAAVVVLAVVFRRQVARLLGQLRSVEVMGSTLTFGEQLAKVEEAVRASTVGEFDGAAAEEEDDGSASYRPARPGPFEGLRLQADSSPSYVVLRSWDLLWTELQSAVVKAQRLESRQFQPGKLDAPYAVSELQKRGFVDGQAASAVDQLEQLRNQVAHGQYQPTPGEALTYLDAVRRLTDSIRSSVPYVAWRPAEMPPSE